VEYTPDKEKVQFIKDDEEEEDDFDDFDREDESPDELTKTYDFG
jgi:hypothetical protein